MSFFLVSSCVHAGLVLGGILSYSLENASNRILRTLIVALKSTSCDGQYKSTFRGAVDVAYIFFLNQKCFCFWFPPRFFSTLVSLRRFQTNIQIPARTRIEKWFDESCRILISLLPIYFDRVASFAKPLYGFEPVHPPPSTTSPFAKNWEAKVTEFLRKQEKGGGPPTAVAVVLDALGADNLHVERGYQGRREEAKEVDARELPERVLWPAVYLRSTLHLDQTPPHHLQRSPSGRGRQGSSSKFLSEWGSSQASSSEQLSSRIFGSSSIRNLDIDPHVLKPKNHILEYGPEGLATSWPHNDWAALVSLLEISPVSEEPSEDVMLADGVKESFRMAEELVAVTYRDDDKSRPHYLKPRPRGNRR